MLFVVLCPLLALVFVQSAVKESKKIAKRGLLCCVVIQGTCACLFSAAFQADGLPLVCRSKHVSPIAWTDLQRWPRSPLAEATE